MLISLSDVKEKPKDGRSTVRFALNWGGVVGRDTCVALTYRTRRLFLSAKHVEHYYVNYIVCTMHCFP